jgi:molecular chaperone GrpE
MSSANTKPESRLLNEKPQTAPAQAEDQESQTGATLAESPHSQTDLEQIKTERDALYERLGRVQAEFENARKRNAREQQEFKEFALADALRSLLPVLDSFDWALQTPQQCLEEFRSGMELVRKQLHDALGKLGVSSIPATGEPFDPQLHEAVEMVNSPNAEDNHVLSEVRRGYKLGTRLLRPSMVSVARKPGS